MGKWWEKGGFTQLVIVNNNFTQSFTILIHRVLHRVLHGISTILVMFRLIIDFLLNLGDLVAEDEVETEVLIDFLDTMHDGSMVFDANFGGNLGGAETEFFG